MTAASHTAYEFTIHEGVEAKSVAETTHRIEQEAVIYKEFTEKLAAVDVKFMFAISEGVDEKEVEQTKKKDEEVKEKLAKAANTEIEKKKEEAKKQHDEADKKVKEAEEAAKKKPEPKPVEAPKKEEKMPDFVMPKAAEAKEVDVEADDDEERGDFETFEKEARAVEGGALDPEGDKEAQEEEE